MIPLAYNKNTVSDDVEDIVYEQGAYCAVMDCANGYCPGVGGESVYLHSLMSGWKV